jgi:hypothetical protein
MANNTTIQLKRTASAGVLPTNLLANGELAVNLTDKRIFTTDTTGGAVFDAMQNTASNLAITGTTVQLMVGNSTINVIANSSLIKVQNSTISSSISIANVITTNVYASFYSTGNIASSSQLGSGTGNTTNFLRGDLTWAVPSGGPGGSPGGSNTQVQFNDSATFNGDADFTFDKATNILALGNNTTGTLYVGNSTVNSIVNSSFLLISNSTVTSRITIANVVTTNVYASFYSTGNIASASQLGSGTANTTTFLRGDLTFAVPTAAAAAGGSNTQVQFNDSTAIAGSAGFTFDKATNNATIANTLTVSTKLKVGSAAGYDFGALALIEIEQSQNTYVQSVIQNANSGTNASGDLVITADTGNDSVNYLDIGINSSLYSNATFSLVGALDAYMYSSNSHLVIGTATAKDVIFHANGTTSADRKMTIGATSIVVNNISFAVSNSTTNSTLSPSLLTIGNSTTYGSFSNTTLLIASNSTVNSIITDASIRIQNSTANAVLNPISLTVTLGNTSGGDIAAPVTNTISFFGKVKGGRVMPSFIGATGFGGWPAMPHIMHNPTGYILPIPGGTTISALRMTSANTIAFTARTPTSANAFMSSFRVSQTTGATAGTSVSWRNAVLQFWRGNAAGLGGFYAVARFGVATVAAQGRVFVGFKDSATILTNANPSSQTNIIGFSYDSGQTNLYAISANSTIANTIDLGAGFPVNTGNTDWYEAIIYAPPNGGTVQYQVTNLKNGNNVIGTYNQTNLPTTTTMLTWQFWGNNGSTAGAQIMDWGGVTIETPL